MVCVFGSFVVADARAIKSIGLGLAIAVLIDATLVRMVLVPATMELLGRTNWWLPRWLDRSSRFAVERHPASARPTERRRRPRRLAPAATATHRRRGARDGLRRPLTTMQTLPPPPPPAPSRPRDVGGREGRVPPPPAAPVPAVTPPRRG